MTDYASGQPSKRAYATFRDQHGRRWGAVTENKTRHPVGPPDALFQAPVLPPNTLIQPDPRDGTAFVINYDQWLYDLDSAHEAWDNALREAAVRLYPLDAVPAALRDPKPELLDQVGPRPRVVRREFVEAAQQGNKWALGLTSATPSWALAILAEEAVATKAAARAVKKWMDVEEELEAPKFPLWQGYGRWQFSDGTTEKMKREDAAKHEAEITAVREREQLEAEAVAEVAGA